MDQQNARKEWEAEGRQFEDFLFKKKIFLKMNYNTSQNEDSSLFQISLGTLHPITQVLMTDKSNVGRKKKKAVFR